MTFNKTWVIFDVHVDGGLDHTAAPVRGSVGDSSLFVLATPPTYITRAIDSWLRRSDEAVSWAPH